MSFSIFFPGQATDEDCDGLDNFDEGVEFSFRLSSAQMEWIPVSFIFPTTNSGNNRITIGTFGNLSLREYSLEMDQEVLLRRNHALEFSYTLCVPKLSQFIGFDYIQFRWLETTQFTYLNNSSKDVWSLDNVKIDFVNPKGLTCLLLDETFESSSLA